MEQLTTKDLLNYFHYDSIRKNDCVALKLLEEYQREIKMYFNFICISPYDEEREMFKHVSQLISLKNDCSPLSFQGNILYSLLSKYNYNFLMDIRDTIGNLGKLDKPSANKEVIEKSLKSPVIQDISFNGKDTFKIVSEEYGDFEYLLAREYFKGCSEVIEYMNNDDLLGHCHKNAEKIANIFSKFYSITSLLSSFFESSYYHSYSYNANEDLVIDLGNNAVFSSEHYSRLMDPKEIMRIKNSKLSSYYDKVIASTQDLNDWNIIFRTALYIQLKNMKKSEKQDLIKTLKLEN